MVLDFFLSFFIIIIIIIIIIITTIISTGLMPSTDLQQAVADMFSEAVYDLENEIVRAVVCENPEEQVV